MNYTLSIILIGSIILSSCGSADEFEIKESEVPANVVAALKAKYPNAQIKKWEAEKEDGKFYFEAEIMDGDKKKDIQVTPDGSSLKEED